MPIKNYKIFLLLCLTIIYCNSLIGQYRVVYKFIDSNKLNNDFILKNDFPSQSAAIQYIKDLQGQLIAVYHVAASIDSTVYGNDSAVVKLYVGPLFTFTSVSLDSISQVVLKEANVRWKKNISAQDIQRKIEQLLDYYENNGHPFATVTLDSSNWSGQNLRAKFKIDPGPLYKIDSIHLEGKSRISNHFLQQYLKIPNGSIYDKRLLNQIGQRIRELPFLRESKPWQLNMQTGGAAVNLFLEPKRSSQVNILIGLLPANQQLGGSKLLLTGEANINLKNALGAGETIGLNWQQIQPKSPRLNLQFQYPYIFRSAFGLDAGFELFKKDSLWVNVNAKIGVLFDLNTHESGKLSLQSTQTSVAFIDTTAIKTSKKLPEILDISSINIGLDYQYNSTNYRLNPRKGWDIQLQLLAGIKSIKRNTDIVKLKDPTDPSFNFSSLYDSIKASSYQVRIKATINRFFPLSRQIVLKTGLQNGWYQSPNIFKNELFQIGGYRLLRGFDEESIYTDLYSVLTAELRYLIAANSYFFGFIDGGYAHYAQNDIKYKHTYLGTGVGLAFETGSSIFNISYAIGKRDDLPMSIKQSKIHFGFINFF